MSKFMKIWTISGKKKAVTASDLQELKQKGIFKLELTCSPENITVYLEDSTEIDENEVYNVLPDGTVLFLCQEGENPSQFNRMSYTDLESSSNTIVDSTITARSDSCGLDEPDIVKKSAWPENFQISFERCSKELIQRMKKGISYLNWQTRHELLNIIAEDIANYTLHPDMKQRKQVAACLVENFPTLKSGIDDGLNGWAERIYEKMKDVRLKNATVEAKAVRMNKKKVAHCVKVPHRGESNFLPNSNLSPDEDSSRIAWMQAEAKKPQSEQNDKKIQQYLNDTFPIRRQTLINKLLLFKEIKETYPLLFTSNNLFTEFKRLQCIEISELMQNFKNYAPKIVLEATKKQPKLIDPDAAITPLQQKRRSAMKLKENILSDFNQADTKEIEHTILCAFLLLPILLNDDSNAMYKIVSIDTQIENISNETTAPVIIFVGNPFHCKEIYICGESEIIIRETDVINAIAALFSLYYVCNVEYPALCISTFLFMQIKLLKLHYSRKLPSKLINLIDKL